MSFEKIKDVIGRRLYHFLALCEDKSLQNVHCLRKVCHYYLVAVVIEDVQIASRHDSVTHCVLLIEETWVCALLNVIPTAPLVNYKTYLTLWITA